MRARGEAQGFAPGPVSFHSETYRGYAGANQLPILETRRAVDALQRYRIPVTGPVVNRVLPDTADGGSLARRRERGAGYRAMIEDELGDLRQWTVPLGETDVVGLDALGRLAAHLGEA